MGFAQRIISHTTMGLAQRTTHYPSDIPGTYLRILTYDQSQKLSKNNDPQNGFQIIIRMRTQLYAMNDNRYSRIVTAR